MCYTNIALSWLVLTLKLLKYKIGVGNIKISKRAHGKSFEVHNTTGTLAISGGF